MDRKHRASPAVTDLISAPKSEVLVRPLTTVQELDTAIALQREVWGYSDLDVDSRSVMTVASLFAGQTLGAFDGPRMIGFSVAFGTLTPGRMHSHRVGVIAEYQNRGVGRMLKLAQRAHAIKRGVQVIQWTFDPLQRRNAFFNLVRLGGISRTYLPNIYGITSSPLHGGLPTDRLLLEWHLQSERVERVLAGDPPPVSEDVREIRLPASGRRPTVEEQARIREQFQHHFNEGYCACGLREDTYILEKL